MYVIIAVRDKSTPLHRYMIYAPKYINRYIGRYLLTAETGIIL